MKGIGEKIKRGLVSWQFLLGAGLFFLGKSLLSLSGISEGMPSMWHVFLIACSGVCALLSGVRLWWEHNGDSSKKFRPLLLVLLVLLVTAAIFAADCCIGLALGRVITISIPPF